ncbi:MAG: hypothetical protein RLZZ46_939 [Bacteroidota bacterium]|jgi:hypothetical protein
MEKKGIIEIHSEVSEWMSKLDFYRHDITIMEKRLSEVAFRNNSKEVSPLIEHFQNQLILQREQIDILEKDVRYYDHLLEDNIIGNPVAINRRKVEENLLLKDNVETFERIFRDLRTDLLDFAAKWM